MSNPKSQVDAKERARQMAGYTVLQKNIRSWAVMRTWEWFKVWSWIRPQLKSGKMAEEMKKAKAKIAVRCTKFTFTHIHTHTHNLQEFETKQTHKTDKRK